ncbi:amidohydrolase family protein [Mesorhizobium escarrei]|uniref:Amidohydro-rel domain-containing protein n=1 Tax=Mesorhizobium escarrei TaxID=666018 RepID=A0ABN8K549_9HYPH|nr:amidohydrolase family protein [Mesorhizobium escarrei]CAH2404134.1 Amidohydro-rel domain-containing protein [Mesorhizobium escarrei]
MIDGLPVIDAVIHAYNMDASNFANRFAKPLADLVYQSVIATARPGYAPTEAQFYRDWSIEETVDQVFVESDTDLAVYHALPIYSFKDGLCSFDKAVEAQQRWPDRMITYCGVDPLTGKAALDELERQVEILKPVGLKLYPNSWVGQEIRGWKMDDPEVAFPLFERAQALGIKVVAIHKALPLGPVPLEHYRVDDIDRACMAFPDLNFEVIHGGIAFAEETAWQLARFPNVYVNLEITCALAASRPAAFLQTMASLIGPGGSGAIDRLVWGTGAMAFHPQPLLETFVRDFAFPQELVDGAGLPQIDREAKRKILFDNYARMTGLDLKPRLNAIESDDFARRRANGPAAPFSTMREMADA